MTQRPVVTIITRTKNRVMLLKRAVESVLRQTYRHWQMVIVNDGGERSPIDELFAHFAVEAGGRITIVHNTRSLGMHGASAVGFEHASGDLIAVHDDDDSWAPEFLDVVVGSLQRIRNDFPSVRGVTTYCNRIVERVQGNLIHIDTIEPFSGWVPPGMLSLDRMLAGNFIPPISFVFERAAFDALEAPYEAVPYLGDWDFFIRFLASFDVYMVPQYLAFYHWRAVSEAAFGNSVTTEVDRHMFIRQVLLNRWLRADLTAGRFGVGTYANLRVHLQTILDRSEPIKP